MQQRPTPDNFATFCGTVNSGTPGVPEGAEVTIEPEGTGWHLYVSFSVPPGRADHVAWDVWCDNWHDAEEWFKDWAVSWEHTPETDGV